MIIEDIRTWLLTCPLLDDEYAVNVDYLSDKLSYSIDPLPGEPWFKKYVNGGGIKQFQFAMTSREYYDDSALQNIQNCGFYQQFEEWIDAQEKASNYPFADCVKVEITTSGYLYENESETARYQIQLRLLYERR